MYVIDGYFIGDYLIDSYFLSTPESVVKYALKADAVFPEEDGYTLKADVEFLLLE